MSQNGLHHSTMEAVLELFVAIGCDQRHGERVTLFKYGWVLPTSVPLESLATIWY